MTAVSKNEIETVAEHITSGGLDKLSNETLLWFLSLARGMTELAEAEIQRRHVRHPR